MLFSSMWSERSRQIIPVVEQICKKNPTVNFLKVPVLYMQSVYCSVHKVIHSFVPALCLPFRRDLLI